MTRRAQPSAAEPVSPLALWLTLGGFLGAVLLNVYQIAPWCAPVALGAVAWRARSAQDSPKLPGRVVRIIVIAVLTVAVVLSFHTLNGVQAGGSLLVGMSALKLSETQRRRDWMIIIGASLFLLLAACLDAQALWRLPLYALEVWLLCTALYALGASPSIVPLGTLGKRAGGSLLAALPLALLLFVLFPRLPGSFWALPRQNEARTGLGDDMSPGSVSKLLESDDPAMRVRFDGPLPPPSERYWRGPVMHDFDGFTWRRHRTGLVPPANLGIPLSLQFLGSGYAYEVTLEPTQHNVLIALELPRGDPPANLPQAFESFDYQMIDSTPNPHAVSYRLESYPRHRNSGPLSTFERVLDLRLGRSGNPRSVELAHTLRAAARSDEDYVKAVLDYLRKGNFQYSTSPPLLARDSVDDLLFHTHEGFCEHYASAFTMLMRAGGVPARVVTGYLGGEWNRFGGYLLIRQSDAHAWSEVWLEGQGWVRVDPTAVVAPGQLSDELAGLAAVAGPGHGGLGAAPPWLRATVQVWQAANAWWQDEFVGFNFTRQIDLIDAIGLRRQGWQALVWMLAGGGGLWLALIAWGYRPRARAEQRDELARIWRLLERKLRAHGGARSAHEGPLSYAERISAAHPEHGASVRAIARRYARLRYGPQPSAPQVLSLRRAVRWLSLRPQR